MRSRLVDTLYGEVLRRIRLRAGAVAVLTLQQLAALLAEVRARESFSFTQRRDVERRLRTMLAEVDRQSEVILATNLRALLREIAQEHSRVTQEIGRAFGIALSGLTVGAILDAAWEGLAVQGGPVATLDTVLDRQTSWAMEAVDHLLYAATEKQIPYEQLGRDLSRLWDGLPIDTKPYGLRPPDVTGLRTLESNLDMVGASETFNAMREGNAVALEESPIVWAAKWTLSPQHDYLKSSPDICDDMAELDSGLGPGMYEPDRWPRAPHPHCACTQGTPLDVAPPAEWGEVQDVAAAQEFVRTPEGTYEEAVAPVGEGFVPAEVDPQVAEGIDAWVEQTSAAEPIRSRSIDEIRASGMFDPHTAGGAILVGSDVPPQWVPGVLAHERGHAFDYLARGRERTYASMLDADLRRAIQDDLHRALYIQPEAPHWTGHAADWKDWADLVYREDHVQRELFADAFAANLGQPIRRGMYTAEQFRAIFPNVTRLVHDQMLQTAAAFRE